MQLLCCQCLLQLIRGQVSEQLCKWRPPTIAADAVITAAPSAQCWHGSKLSSRWTQSCARSCSSGSLFTCRLPACRVRPTAAAPLPRCKLFCERRQLGCCQSRLQQLHFAQSECATQRKVSQQSQSPPAHTHTHTCQSTDTNKFQFRRQCSRGRAVGGACLTENTHMGADEQCAVSRMCILLVCCASVGAAARLNPWDSRLNQDQPRLDQWHAVGAPMRAHLLVSSCVTSSSSSILPSTRGGQLVQSPCAAASTRRLIGCRNSHCPSAAAYR